LAGSAPDPSTAGAQPLQRAVWVDESYRGDFRLAADGGYVSRSAGWSRPVARTGSRTRPPRRSACRWACTAARRRRARWVFPVSRRTVRR